MDVKSSFFNLISNRLCFQNYSKRGLSFFVLQLSAPTIRPCLRVSSEIGWRLFSTLVELSTWKCTFQVVYVCGCMYVCVVMFSKLLGQHIFSFCTQYPNFDLESRERPPFEFWVEMYISWGCSFSYWPGQKITPTWEVQ